MSEALLRRVFPRDLHHVEGLHKAIATAIPDRARILDLGCGKNADLARYRTRTREVWGSDYQSHPELRHPRWFVKLRKDGTIPFPDAHFDTVVTVMVLEHIVDPQLFLQEVSRVLRPGGRFIGHSISGRHYVTFISRLFGLLPHWLNQRMIRKLYNRRVEDTFPAYYRMNSEGVVRRNCDETGLTLTGFQRYADPGYFRFSKPLMTAAILADRLLDGLVPGWGRLYFTAIAAKPDGVSAKMKVRIRHAATATPAVNRITEPVH
ncbi:MAG TPA: methyltransferase domain-containing protein [Gemmata sp.]|nr:methyltransferase domain-containing protein [Gemmata sp.]